MNNNPVEPCCSILSIITFTHQKKNSSNMCYFSPILCVEKMSSLNHIFHLRDEFQKKYER